MGCTSTTATICRSRRRFRPETRRGVSVRQTPRGFTFRRMHGMLIAAVFCQSRVDTCGTQFGVRQMGHEGLSVRRIVRVDAVAHDCADRQKQFRNIRAEWCFTSTGGPGVATSGFKSESSHESTQENSEFGNLTYSGESRTASTRNTRNVVGPVEKQRW
jgi:hypothetical protein